jgi:outer membrane protein assembly factor BamB
VFYDPLENTVKLTCKNYKPTTYYSRHVSSEQKSPADYASAVAAALTAEGWRLDATHVADTVYLLGGTHTEGGQVAVVIVAAGLDESLDKDHLSYLLKASERYDANQMLAHARGGVPDDIRDYCRRHDIALRSSSELGLTADHDDERSRRAVLLLGLLGLTTSGVLLWDGLPLQSGPESDSGGEETDEGSGQTATFENGVTELWTRDLGSKVARPAVSDGAVHAGVAADSLFALDGATGDQQWRVEIPQGASSPAAAGGTVYGGGHNERLYAVNADSGDVTWTLDVANVVRDVTVSDGTVYAPVPSPFGRATEANPHRLYAVDAATGETTWVFENPTIGGEIRSPPPVVNGTVYAQSEAGTLYALDAATGDEQWTVDFTSTVSSSVSPLLPAVANGSLYVSLDGGRGEDEQGTLLAIHATDGSERWRVTVDGDIAYPAVTDGIVAVPNEGQLRGYEATTGTEQWSYRPDEGPQFVSHPTALGSTFLLTGSTTLYAVDAESGERRWTFEMAAGLSARPTVGDGRLYVGRTNGTLSALQAA